MNKYRLFGILCSRVFLVLPLFYFSIPISSLADESIQCHAPPGWRDAARPRERWGGPDPTFGYDQGFDTRIRVTHYGLEGTKTGAAESYIHKLRSLWSRDDFLNEQALVVDGRRARVIRLYYEIKGYTDYHHGTVHIPPEYLYEEFVILPASLGYWVLAFTAIREIPYPHPETDRKQTHDMDVQLRWEEWRHMLKGCQFEQ